MGAYYDRRCPTRVSAGRGRITHVIALLRRIAESGRSITRSSAGTVPSTPDHRPRPGDRSLGRGNIGQGQSDTKWPCGRSTAHRIKYARFLDLCREGCHTPIGARLWAKTPVLRPNVGAIRRRAPQAAPPALSQIHRRNGICPDQLPAGSWSCSSHADSKTASITEGSWKPLASSSPLATSSRKGS